MSALDIKRRQSINYINDDDAPLLLTFNSLERGDLDDDFPKTNSFMYNSQEDMYRINSLKKSRMTERVNSNNLEVIDEEGDNSIQIGKEDEYSNSIIDSNLTNINFKEEKLGLLFIIMICYLIFCIIELLFGYFFNSLILMADAAHYFSESSCFGFYIIIIYITKRKSTISFSFHRGEIMGILVRASFILGFSFWLIFYIIKSFLNNHLANGIAIIIMGIISTLYNLIMGLILMLVGLSNDISFSMKNNKSHSEDELKRKKIKISSIIFKSIQSIIIILTGVLVYFLPSVLYIDPVCSLLLTLVLLYNSFYHLNGSIKLLLKDSPLEFNDKKLIKDLKEIEGVVDVLSLHIWNLNGKKSLSCHLMASDPQNTLIKLREFLKNKYNITHSTIQVELNNGKKRKTKDN